MAQEADHLAVSLPEQKNYDTSYGLAYKMAAEKLASMPDWQGVCRRTDAMCTENEDHRTFVLEYLKKIYRVTWPAADIRTLDPAEAVELRDKILILHYLTQASGVPLSGHLIAYKELREGAGYYPSFFKRAIRPLTDFFGQQPGKLLEAAAELGGQPVNLGDVAVTIPAFRRVPITLVVRKGDDEFPPDANVLFDETVLDYLPVEDVNVLCQTIVWRLVKSAQSSSKSQ